MNISYIVAILFTFFLIKIGHAWSGEEKKIWVTLDRDALSNKYVQGLVSWEEKSFGEDLVVGTLLEKDISKLSEIMHQEFHRCGGFMASFNENEALATLANESRWKELMPARLWDYTVDQGERVDDFITQVEDSKILSTIKTLSSFPTRHYQSPSGKSSALWIRDEWAKLSQHRVDIKVELITHRSWQQPSVILTFEGSDPAEKDFHVIMGGHLDSIVGGFGGSGSRAPGADDNASGIAVLTEVIRVLIQNDYRPKKTLQFIGYAGEEAGLLGSKEIAARYKQEKKSVFGVLQLDMTNFKGSSVDIGLISDYTNASLNQFLALLIDTYVKLPWEYTRCGYACSDHASWTTQGFPATFPFEALKEGMNQKIHTAGDLVEVSRSSALHAAKFAKLGLSFAVEMAK